MESLKLEELETFKEMYEKEDYACRESACARTELKDIVYLPLNAAKLVREFNVEVKTRGITAQLKSGRCWMFYIKNFNASNKRNPREVFPGEKNIYFIRA